MKYVIPDWKRAWSFASVQLAALSTTFGLLPLDQQAAILDAVGIPPTRLPAVIGLLFIAGRLFKKPE